MPRLTLGCELFGGFVVPADGAPPEEVLLGFDLPVDALGESVGLADALGSVNGEPPGPARSDTSLVEFTSVNGSLTMLAAAKPTLTEATAKTAQRATSVTLLDTANLRMCGTRPLSVRDSALTPG
jgi:hypothetical protein